MIVNLFVRIIISYIEICENTINSRCYRRLIFERFF